jgi:small-conductance mechanosensitive channel
MEDYVSRREVDQLRGELTEIRQSVDTLKSGNAAIAVLSTQISTITRDLSELKSDMTTKFARHEEVHEADEKARSSGRRWLIGTTIAALGVIVGLYGWVALLLHK